MTVVLMEGWVEMSRIGHLWARMLVGPVRLSTLRGREMACVLSVAMEMLVFHIESPIFGGGFPKEATGAHHLYGLLQQLPVRSVSIKKV